MFRWAWVIFLVFHALWGPAATAQSLLEADEFIVTDVRVVEGRTEVEAREKCAALCPCSSLLSQHVVSNWRIVGSNLNSASDSGSSGAEASFVYLCVKQDRFALVHRDPTTFFAAQAVHVIEDSMCPSSLRLLYQPRPGVVICLAVIPAPVAFATGMYISEITTVVNPTDVQDSSGWTTLTTSIETEPRISRGSTTRPASLVYLSYKRPRRPISDVRVLADVAKTDMWKACWSTLGPAWEQAGSGYIKLPSIDTSTIVCVQRPQVPVIELAQAATLINQVLVAVRVFKTGEACPDGFQAKDVLSNSWVLCLKYDESSAKTFISSLSLTSAGGRFSNNQDHAGLHSALTLSTPDKFASTEDLNEARGGVSSFLIFREYQPRQKKTTKAPRSKSTPEPSGAKPPLMAKFTPTIGSDNSGRLSFKVLQLADLHFTGDRDWPCKGPPTELLQCGLRCSEDLTESFVHDILDKENPDFVVFSGDAIQVRDPRLRDAAIEAALRPVESRTIPYAVIMGNHDDDYGFEREEIISRIAGRKLSYTERGPKSIFGVGNYVLDIKAPAEGPWGANGTKVFRMYLLDSNKRPDRIKFPTVNSNYDWIRPDQIEFYRQHSLANRPPEGPLPAIMFFHIPFPEYNVYFRHNGDKNEAIEGPGYNSHLFDTLVELQEVKATFVGHDHVNEYCAERSGIQLCYGGGTGFGEAYGRSYIARRARVIEWSVDTQNRRRITSWKRHFGTNFHRRQLQEVLYSES
ncbi:hypothetical protein Poli38472_008276 [Pythium oligandrum]|uniref:Calcineurin-like phosphoesterase domain-containing protein n=1 Tax=Pythium oligandrum TaxID=41045 RepID=A0A8K1CLC2_PYTOL|nr:hypothetical protein Poli38472_008276 [Pythium oligandrum]|eukprot:TMW65634.1 hypothetical protein Poli38472_008276 [Pythium oligandrum]